MAAFVRAATQGESSRTPPAAAQTNAKIAAARGHDASSEFFLCFDDAMVAITRATSHRFLPFVFCVDRCQGEEVPNLPAAARTNAKIAAARGNNVLSKFFFFFMMPWLPS